MYRERQFSSYGARLGAKRQPQRFPARSCLVLCGRAAAGRDDTAALRVRMRIALWPANDLADGDCALTGNGFAGFLVDWGFVSAQQRIVRLSPPCRSSSLNRPQLQCQAPACR